MRIGVLFRRRSRLIVGVVLGIVALGGCGVGGQPKATVIPSDDIPSVLREPVAAPSASPSPQFPSSIVYLVRAKQDVLVAVRRPAEQTQTLAALLRSLLAGPTDAEVAAGLTSALTAVSTLNGVMVSGSLATIDLASAFADIRGQAQILATAQLVLTAVSFPGIDSVLIELDGHPVTVPLADGTLTSRPLQANDYSCLVAGASPCATSSESPPPPVALPSASLSPSS